jgi:hypothetical protein
METEFDDDEIVERENGPTQRHIEEGGQVRSMTQRRNQRAAQEETDFGAPLIRQAHHETIEKQSEESGTEQTKHGYIIYCLAALCGVHAQTKNGSSGPKALPLFALNHKKISAKRQSETWRQYVGNQRIFGRPLVLIANIIAVVSSTVAYVMRLNVKYLSASYVAATGLDHRCGWWSIGAVAVLGMSVYIQLQYTEWEVIEKLPIEKQREAQYQGRRTFCFDIAVAGFIQDLLLIRTNRYSSIQFFQASANAILEFLVGPGIVFTFILLLTVWPLSNRYSRSGRSLLGDICLLVVLLFLPTFTIQIYFDYEEVKQLKQGIYFPWNYRWAQQVRMIEWLEI